MEHEQPNIIVELDFVLTHPSCNVSIIEKFYNNCLYVYETVPLFVIVDHIRQSKPKLLIEWSIINKAVRSLLNEMEPKDTSREVDESKKKIIVEIDLTTMIPAQNGIYQIPWETEIEEPIINAHFKTKSLLVVDFKFGNVELLGISNIELNKYNLYVKKGG
jgi:hypothetical protein